MRVTAKYYKKILRIIEALHEHTDEYELRNQIAKPLLDLLGADYFASFRWDEQQRCYRQPVFLNMDENNIQRYSDYYQYHDPITYCLALRRQATLVDEIMPHEELRHTEFFNDFLLADGLNYGINLHLYHREKNIGDLRIWRNAHRDAFDESSCMILDLLKPHLIQAINNIRRMKRLIDECRDPHLDQQGLHLKTRLGLTDREADVAGWILRGEQDICIANRLNISVTTVRTHIKNIFQKTGVNSRTKLLAIAS